MRTTRRRLTFNIAVLLLAVLVVTTASAATVAPALLNAGTTCTKVASPNGFDTGAGSAAAPFKTVGKLVSSLHGGETGCLRGGSYAQDVIVTTASITLASYPGEQATVVGRFWIKQGADGVVVTGLHLDGKNIASLPSPTVNGNDDQFVGNDITDEHTEICFLIGSTSWGRAQRTVIKGNRIHDCGVLPSTNQDHGIYVSSADDTQILDNVIVNNADRGIQLYPDAQRTIVRGNIIDGNGEGIIFSGDTVTASSNTVVRGNAITGSKIRHDVESYWTTGGPVGTGNLVSGNCIRGGVQGEIGAQSGFSASSNTIAAPGYVNTAAGDYRIATSSPCAAVLTASMAPAGPNGEPPLTSTPPPWHPVQGARVKITKTTSPDYGQLGEVTYVSADGKRVMLLMDNVTAKAALATDIGPASP